MLWTILIIFMALWMLGLVSGFAVDNFIHIPLFIAIVALLFQIEAECNHDGSCLARKKRYMKRQRQLINKSEKT